MCRRRWYTLPISNTLVAPEFWGARTIAAVYRAYLRALLVTVGRHFATRRRCEPRVLGGVPQLAAQLPPEQLQERLLCLGQILLFRGDDLF
jgi:hypothetical protein